MDITFARRLISQPGEATTKQLFEGRHAGIFWVDWREADDDIVAMVADAIGEALDINWVDTRLHIAYRGKTTEVPLAARPGEQDLTLAGLNRALTGRFQIRYVAASEGGDTIAFIVLPVAEWFALESEFGGALHRALPKLDPTRPLFGGSDDISKEAVAARIEQANPGVLGALKFHRTAFRLINRDTEQRLRAEHAASPDALPVMRPLCGDLVISYFRDMLDSSDVITEGDLRSNHLSHDDLFKLARNYTSEAWQKFGLQRQHGVGSFVGNERVDSSSFALCGAYWTHLTKESGALVAAFPRRDLALFVRADDADGISFLIDLIDGVDRNDPKVLSMQLFAWIDGAWQVRAVRDGERRPTLTALSNAAATGDYSTQYSWAFMYQTYGLASKAASIYRRAGEQAEKNRVYSPDMFVNGSALLCNLADLYEHGNGVAQDYAEAHDLYRRSASMDNFVAEYSLGNLYRNGHGVPRDLEKAKYWLQRSSAQGYADARKVLREIG